MLVVRKCLLTMLLCLAVAGPAAASEDPNVLFNQALELAQAGDTEAAVDLWLKVLHKVEDRFRPSVHRTLGLGFGKLGRLPEAAYHLRAHLDTRLESQSKKTRQKLAGIEEKLATTHFQMTIACDPADAIIHLSEDGAGAGYSCPLKWWFPKGRHAVRVARVGYRHSITHVVVQEGQESPLHAISLKALQPDTEEQREEKMDLLRRLKKAAGAGQASVVRSMAMEHGTMLKELPCEYGWSPAVRGITVKSCNTAVITALVEAGVERCPTMTALASAVGLGCPKAVEYMLPLLSDADVAMALEDISTTARYNATAAEALGLMSATELGMARVRTACSKGALDSKPCRVVEEVNEEMSSYFGAIVTRVDDDTLLAILALRPKLTRRYHCNMVSKVFSGLQPEKCDEAVHRLSLFYLTDGPECDHKESLKRAIRYRCAKGLTMLLKTAVAEDLAAATHEYNTGKCWVPSGPWTDHNARTKEVLTLGKLLHQANTVTCREQGPDSPTCAASRYVEEQMELVRDGQERVNQPAVLLKEICAYQYDLDRRTKSLERVKRVGELSGVPNVGELTRYAEMIIGYESSIEALSTRYKKVSRKKYSPGLCK